MSAETGDSAGPDAAGPVAAGPVSADDRTIEGLTRVIAKVCRRLGDAGQPKEAAALAAEGWVLLRGAHAKEADRLDGTMHYLARLEAKVEG